MTDEQGRGHGSDQLRIALLVDSLVLSRYQREVVAQLQGSSFANITAVVRARPAVGNIAPGGALFDWYERFDVRRRNDQQHDPLDAVDCTDLLSSLPSTAFGDIGDTVEINRVDGGSFDVVINFASTSATSDLASATKHGVWSIEPNEPGSHRGRGVPPFFWEAYDGADVSAFSVVVDTAGGQLALSTGYYATQTTSLAWNRRQPYWASVVVLLQRLEVLHDRGWAEVSRKSVPFAQASDTRGFPSTRQMIAWISKNALRRILKRARRPTVNHWRIAIRIGSPLRLVEGRDPDLSGFRFHESPRGHYYADPFLWFRDGKYWLFFEDYSYATRRGTLACAQVLADGTLGRIQSVLERPYHLSYPCLFQDGDQLYMIPETAANGTVELYRCVEFPGRWEFDRTLLDVAGIDTTIVEAQGRVWLMTSVPEPHAMARQLRLYSAPHLFGEWVPHPANPISTDIRTNRGAGAFVKDGDRLLYLSQDSSRSYGYSFAVHEVTTLTTEQYEARPLLTVEPNWAVALTGTHTYARCGAVEAIDAVTPRLRSDVVMQ